MSALSEGVYAHFVTNYGEFTAQLFTDKVPRTTSNFIGLAEGTLASRDPQTGEMEKKHYFDGVIFHRIINGFVIQGGDPTGTGMGGPGFRFEDEFHPQLRHKGPGMLSMANAGPNTNGSQFFITLTDLDYLDDKHAVFGKIMEGMDVIQKIAQVKTDREDRPVDPVVMEKVRVFSIDSQGIRLEGDPSKEAAN